MAHFELIEKMAPNAVIKVVGVGGGGGNAVAHMVNSAVDGVDSSLPTPTRRPSRIVVPSCSCSWVPT